MKKMKRVKEEDEKEGERKCKKKEADGRKIRVGKECAEKMTREKEEEKRGKGKIKRRRRKHDERKISMGRKVWEKWNRKKGEKEEVEKQ